MHQTQGPIVAFSYDYERLLDTVWQRTSYIARATKTPEQKNDIREKAMSPDDELLFHDVISMAAANCYTPLIKYGREVKHAFTINVDKDGFKKLSWNFNQNFEINAAYADPTAESGLTGKIIKVNFIKLADSPDLSVKYKIKLRYAYTVKTVVGYNEQRFSETTFEQTRTTAIGSSYTVSNLSFKYDAVDNGVGAESIVSYDDVTVLDVDIKKTSPDTINAGTFVEYTAKNGATYLIQAPKQCTENDVFDLRYAKGRPSIVTDYVNKVCYEVKMDQIDYSMVPVIDASLFDALVCESVLRWTELANPAYMQQALLAQQRSAEALDKAVFNAVPHIHRVHQHFY